MEFTEPQASPRAASEETSHATAGVAEDAKAGLTARLDALSARISSVKSTEKLPTTMKALKSNSVKASALVPGVMTRAAPVTGTDSSAPGPPSSDSSYDKM